MKKPVELQRRKPIQSRAQVTVDSILEAAVQVLQSTGPEGLNTNRVAERAGVSIGTLYQYFPDKETILLAIARRELATPQTGLVLLQKTLMEALIRAVESLLGKGAARSRRSAHRISPARNNAAKRDTSALERLFLPILVPAW